MSIETFERRLSEVLKKSVKAYFNNGRMISIVGDYKFIANVTSRRVTARWGKDHQAMFYV